MNDTLRPAGTVGETDFGREVAGRQTAPSIATALRLRSKRNSAAEAMRFQVAMGVVGYVAGLALVVPAVFWLVGQGSGAVGTSPSSQPSLSTTIRSDAAAVRPAARVPAPVPSPSISLAPPAATAGLPLILNAAREEIRVGRIASARRLLEPAELAESGEARFMLAETYDPNVLAALGATGVIAETSMARRHYEAASRLGIEAAARRLEALD
jgi:hypothetical protein